MYSRSSLPICLNVFFSGLCWFPACIASSSCSFRSTGFQLVLQARLALFDLIYFLHLIKKKQTRIRDNRSKRKTKIDCILCIFLVVAGDGDPHRQRRKTGKKKMFPIHWFSTASGSSAWSNTPLLFRQTQNASQN